MNRNAREAVRGLYSIIDTSYITLQDAPAALALVLEAGCRLVQLRAKGAPSYIEFLKTASIMAEIAYRSNAVFIINDDVEACLASKAHGIHIGQTDATIIDARKRLGPDAIIGVSTHNAAEAIQAEATGADYISFGPIFPTRTKPDADTPKGIATLAELRRLVNIPIAAIGGITESNAPEVMAAGADAVAVISDILLAKDIRLKTAALIKAIGG